MDDKFLEYLYVTGELDKGNALANDTISELYSEYNMMFPNYPLDNNFFFNSEADQIRMLEEAINTNTPIIGRTR